MGKSAVLPRSKTYTGRSACATGEWLCYTKQESARAGVAVLPRRAVLNAAAEPSIREGLPIAGREIDMPEVGCRVRERDTHLDFFGLLLTHLHHTAFLLFPADPVL